MKTLNLFVLIFLSFLFIGNINAQEEVKNSVNGNSGTYVRAALGYGFGAGVNSPLGETLETSLGAEISNIGEPNQTNSNIYGSYGKGFSATIAVGHKFNKYFGMELGASYLVGAKQTIVDISTAAGGSDISETYTRQFRIKPSLVFEAGDGKIVPFSRLGLVIPVVGASYGERESNDPALLSSLVPLLYPNAVSFSGESVAKGKFAIGFEGAIGAKYNLNDKMGITAELFYTSLRVKRKTYEVKSATLTNSDGTQEDVLELLSLAGVNQFTEYKDEINQEELAEYIATAGDAYGTEDFPAWSLREDGLFNAVGLNVGFTFQF